MTTYAEKLLPHDLEAEEAVLGSVLIDGECLTRLVPLLKLTGVCKNEIIATNRPCHLWIPAYAGMMEWA